MLIEYVWGRQVGQYTIEPVMVAACKNRDLRFYLLAI